ncbi:MAG: 16S rRNA (cytosine(1402)-N(4))-methyltransferase RsmH [Microbacter sp.]
MNAYHIPALLEQSIEGLHINPDGIYVDVTFGGGGHSSAILNRLSSKGRLFAFDQDKEALANGMEDERVVFVHGNFRYLSNFLRYYQVNEVDGILADLGVSFHHFDSPERGFSFRFDGALDMRMNSQAELTAEQVLNRYSEEQLADLFYRYGEIKASRKLASMIVERRKDRALKSTYDLVEVLQQLFRSDREKKEMAKAFQALRIEVNHEMESLEAWLLQTPRLLKENGRLVVITYHSLEDRMVKNFMRSGNLEGVVKKDFFGCIQTPFAVITGKPVTPSEAEIAVNPRSRSAKLRIVERINKSAT